MCVSVRACVAAGRPVPGLVILSPTRSLMWSELRLSLSRGTATAHTHTVLTCLCKHTLRTGMQAHSQK